MLRFNPTREECAVLDAEATSWEDAREFISDCEEETLECECARDHWSRVFASDGNEGLANSEPHGAISRYDKAILLDRDNFGAWFGRACAYFVLSNYYRAEFYGRALESLDGALAVQSVIGEKELFSALMLRSAIYFAMGDENSALGILEEGLPAYPPASVEGAWLRSTHRQIRNDQVKPFSLFGSIFNYFYLMGDSPAMFAD